MKAKIALVLLIYSSFCLHNLKQCISVSQVTQLMEPLRISCTDSAQTPWDYSGSGKQGGGEDVRCQEKTTGAVVSRAEESHLHGLAEDEEERLLGKEVGERWS